MHRAGAWNAPHYPSALPLSMGDPDQARYACSPNKNLGLAAFLLEPKCLSSECLPNSTENRINLSRSKWPLKVQ